MKPLTPKELELKSLIDSLNDFANEAIKVTATKSLGLSILNELKSPVLYKATKFLSMREEWLETSYTNNLTDVMKVELVGYLEAARRLDKAKDSFEVSRKVVTVLKELQGCLESVLKGHSSKGETIDGKEVPERFYNRWDDLDSVISGLLCLHKVKSNPDFRLGVKISAPNTDILFDKLDDLISRSVIVRYVTFEVNNASCENNKKQWNRVLDGLKIISGL